MENKHLFMLDMVKREFDTIHQYCIMIRNSADPIKPMHTEFVTRELEIKNGELYVLLELIIQCEKNLGIHENHPNFFKVVKLKKIVIEEIKANDKIVENRS